jgi:hypothetical protein
MANSVDLVIGSEAIKQVESLISKLSLADAELIKISQSAMGASKGIGGISTPSGLDKAVTNTANLNAQLEKQNTIINKLHADIAKKAEQSRLSEIRLQQQREKAFDSFDKNSKKEQAIQEKNANAYNKTQTQINNLTKVYNDLAIRKERYNNLTANEEMRLNTLGKVTEKYNGILKATDAQIGKNQRNVGNYASGYNALGNSINQLSREAPAFANSVNTGFMALSNNFPALFDAINGIRDKNKLLVAEGKPTVSVLKSIAGAVFGWQTLLSVGVTLLTLYGAKLVDYARGLGNVEKALKSLEKAQKDSDGRISDTTRNIEVQSEIAIAQAKRRGASQNELDDIKIKGQKDVLVNLQKERDLAKSTYEEAVAFRKKGIEAVKLQYQEELKINNDKLKSLESGRTRTEILYKGNEKEVSITSKKIILLQEKQEQEIKRIKATSDEEVFKKIKDGYTKAENAVKLHGQKLNLLNENINTSQYESSNKTINAKEEEIEALRGTEKWYEAQINKLKDLQATTADTTEEYKAFTTQIELLEKALKLLKDGDLGTFGKPVLTDTSGEDIPSTFIEEKDTKDPNEWIKQYNKDVENAKKATEALKQATDNWLQSFSSEFLQNSGLGSLETFFDGTFDKLLEGAETTEEKFAVTFNAIAESAQEAFNFISNASQANFDGEIKRIEDQQAIALTYAGGSASAIAKINEDAEKQKKEIANRENKAKQKQAIFNIAIDTAQGIVSALASTPPNIPLSIAIGVLGAVQLGLVASQKVPQYFDGTDNHIGGMMLINDGAGSNFQEKVILPNGKEIMPEGRNVLMNAPKGTKVLTHEQQIMQMLNERGISLSIQKQYQSNGMTEQQMEGVMMRTLGAMPKESTIIDGDGFKRVISNGHSKTITNNNRVSGRGIRV